MIKVTAVRPGSIAEELGLVPGSELVSIDGRDNAEYDTLRERLIS